MVRPMELIGQKVVGMVSRSGTAKRITDLADIHRLLLTFPDLKVFRRPRRRLSSSCRCSEHDSNAWREIAEQEIIAEDEDEGF